MKSICLTFLLLISTLLFSQEYKFGKVTVAELQESQNSLDPEAEAAIVYYYNRTCFPNSYSEIEKEIYVRIKIYDKDKAEDYLSQIIPIYNGTNDRETLTGLKAVTYNLEGGQVVETKLEKENIFLEEKNKYLKLQKFTFANVKNGSVLEFKYKISSPFVFNIKAEYFQYNIPLMWADYQFEYPDFINYFADEQGEISPTQRYNTTKTWDSRFQAIVKKNTYKNVPARKSEDFVLNPNNLKPSVRYEIISINFPGQLVRNFSTTWSAIHKQLMEDEDFGQQIQNTKAVDELVPSIIAGKATIQEKAIAILEYVQNNMKWNEYMSYNTEKGIRKTLIDKEGNSADINLTLYSMLKSAGIDAYPVVLSTLYNGIINYANASMAKLNYVIVAYYDQNELHLIDATHKYASIDQLPLRALNDRGFLMKSTGFVEIPLVNKTMSRNITSIKASLKENKIVGEYTNQKTNFLALNEIDEYEEDKEKYEKDIKEDFSSPLENLTFQNEKGSFKTTYQFTYDEDLEIIDDKIIFNPMLFLKTDKQNFSSTNRTYNIEFGTQFNQYKKIIFEIPEGYEVETPLKSQPIKLPEGIVEYNYAYHQKDNLITITSSLKVNSAIFPANYYDAFKEVWTYIMDLENQFIVLKKK